jgi:hypothetical protein
MASCYRAGSNEMLGTRYSLRSTIGRTILQTEVSQRTSRIAAAIFETANRMPHQAGLIQMFWPTRLLGGAFFV